MIPFRLRAVGWEPIPHCMGMGCRFKDLSVKPFRNIFWVIFKRNWTCDASSTTGAGIIYNKYCQQLRTCARLRSLTMLRLLFFHSLLMQKKKKKASDASEKDAALPLFCILRSNGSILKQRITLIPPLELYD